jgi:predicted Zn-dependent protease
MIPQGKARQLLDRVLVLAHATKGAEATVLLHSYRTGNTRFARSEITSSAVTDKLALTITVQFGARSASAMTNQLDDHSIDDVVARAIRMARLAPENPEAMPPLGRQTYVATKSGGDPKTAGLTAAARADAVAKALAQGRGAKLEVAGSYVHYVSAKARADSAGLSAYHESTTCEFTCTARTPDGTGSGWAGRSSDRVADLDTEALAKIAVDKAKHSASPKKLDAGRYTVVLEPAAVIALLDFLTGALGARRADEGRSFFSKPGGGTRIGDKLFPDTITLRSDPTDAATGGTPFDDDGFAMHPTNWIDKGVLTGLTYGRYWAKKQNKQATGQPWGWTLEGGKATRDEMIKGVKRGVLVTRFWYLRELDPQTLLATGLTRDGTFLIENGEIAGPVNNFRFNESPVHMLANADAFGPSGIVNAEGSLARAPLLRTNEFNLASVSEAV